MFQIRIVQAFQGDCLILEYGSEDNPKYTLIDGGPGNTYQEHLRSELVDIRSKGGELDLVVLSHVDDDHANGLLDLMRDMDAPSPLNINGVIPIKKLWHNSFSETLTDEVARGFDEGMARSGANDEMPTAAFQHRSIRQGSHITLFASSLDIPINEEFPQSEAGRLICVDNADNPISLANLKISVVGPTRKTLSALQKKWLKWIEKQKEKGESKGGSGLDKSVPNLSSIMLLVEGEGKTILLTGDGRGDHLLIGLEEAQMLNADGTLHVDLFKLPHHGSARNVTAELFEKITADTYVVCANGRHDNPDYQTLEWLVLSAQKQDRRFHLIATNETDSTRLMRQNYPPAQYNYRFTALAPTENSLLFDIKNGVVADEPKNENAGQSKEVVHQVENA
ncbi:MAG: MBL fold metallo-hydrolase [Chloroflexota bacterium]